MTTIMNTAEFQKPKGNFFCDCTWILGHKSYFTLCVSDTVITRELLVCWEGLVRKQRIGSFFPLSFWSLTCSYISLESWCGFVLQPCLTHQTVLLEHHQGCQNFT